MSTQPTRIKFCGMTRVEDAELALELEAWAVGMVFHRESPRHCEIDDAFEIATLVKRKAESVGVFYNATLDSVARIADLVGLTLIQLHGDEGPDYCSEISRRTGCGVIKAARVKSPADVLDLRIYPTAYHLLDTHVPEMPGGTGESFPWEFAGTHQGPAPFILAGGLRADNVIEAIEAAHPFAVDVASGTEAGPGVKDPVRMRDFADAVRSTDPFIPEEEVFDGGLDGPPLEVEEVPAGSEEAS
ncbi:MAG: phosphoribosylanthranilate isomerase [Solirubrobacterales bacterium]|nr:phosphoribosylanthranilate isomerase [Solirubrobacterales bacterium]